MEGSTAGQEPTLLGLICAVNQAHELGHAVAVEVGRTESVFLHGPARWEDDKISNGNTRLLGLACEHCEDGGVNVVVGDRVDGVEKCEVVLVRGIVSVPSNNIEGRVVLFGSEQAAAILVDDTEGLLLLDECSNRGLEVAAVGKTVGTNRSEVGNSPGSVEDLADVATAWSIRKSNRETNATLDDANLIGMNQHLSELGGDVQTTLLGNNQKVSIRVVEGCILHALVGGVDEDTHTVLDANITGTSNRVQSLNKVGGLSGQIEGRPAQLVGHHVDISLIRIISHEPCLLVEGFIWGVADRRADAIQPTPFVVLAINSEGSS